MPQTQTRPIATRCWNRFAQVRAASIGLADELSEADCTAQSMPDASPVKWHLAHTTWFFETFILERAIPGYQPVDPAYRVLFNSYYNGVGDQFSRPERGLITRPGLDAVLGYRRRVDASMRALISRKGGVDDELLALIELGLQHEQQHQELILTDFKHLLSRNPLRPAYRSGWPLMKIAARASDWIGYDGGLCEIGMQSDAAAADETGDRAAGAGFAFDNELPRHRVYLNSYALAAYPVTNGEYLQFMADSGYERPELWLSMGWTAVGQSGWRAPAYWHMQDGQWHAFTLRGMVPVDLNTPVCHLSYFEADAYARWAGARLPTEAEWEHAAQRSLAANPGLVEEGNFVGSGMLHPVPAREARRAGMPAQLFGDVWEWTSSTYGAYPGFQPAAGLVGEYNGKFMCNQYVLRGGSCATPADHIRPSYRNFFPPDARWQFSGLRLARDAG